MSVLIIMMEIMIVTKLCLWTSERQCQIMYDNTIFPHDNITNATFTIARLRDRKAAYIWPQCLVVADLE